MTRKSLLMSMIAASFCAVLPAQAQVVQQSRQPCIQRNAFCRSNNGRIQTDIGFLVLLAVDEDRHFVLLRDRRHRVLQWHFLERELGGLVELFENRAAAGFAGVRGENWNDHGALHEARDLRRSDASFTQFPQRGFSRQFDLIGWRIIDLADPDPQMYANFHTGSPSNLAQYSDPEIDRFDPGLGT